VLDVAAAFLDLDVATLRRRRGGKWSRYGPDVLPAWVADMDFPPAPVIGRALHDLVDRGDLGYPADGSVCGLPEAFAARAARRWGWHVDPGLVHPVADVMRGISAAILAFSEPGDPVVLTTPIYPPFIKTVRGHGRRIVECPLLAAPWRIDLDGLTAAFAREHPRVALVCNPHNPTGHSLSEAELRAIAALANQYGTLVVSDEIHADLVYREHSHIPMATLGADAPARLVTVTSASKAFNLAGLRCALAVAAGAELLAGLVGPADLAHEPISSPGVDATLAAWTAEGDEWLAACVDVLDGNRNHVIHRLRAEAPEVVVERPDATYLAWLDCRTLGLGDNPARHLLKRGRVALSQGPDFGDRGRGFARLNFATSPRVLDAVLDRVIEALRDR